MHIQERIVSIKKHTIGYVIDGNEYTRREAVQAVQKGKVRNAVVVHNAYGPHLVGKNGTTLYGLPIRHPTSRRLANKRSK